MEARTSSIWADESSRSLEGERPAHEGSGVGVLPLGSTVNDELQLASLADDLDLMPCVQRVDRRSGGKILMERVRPLLTIQIRACALEAYVVAADIVETVDQMDAATDETQPQAQAEVAVEPDVGPGPGVALALEESIAILRDHLPAGLQVPARKRWVVEGFGRAFLLR